MATGTSARALPGPADHRPGPTGAPPVGPAAPDAPGRPTPGASGRTLQPGGRTRLPSGRTRLWRAATGAARLARRPTAHLRPPPTFLIVGAQRSGTTSLARALWSHPAVMGPAFAKGVHYYDVAYGRGDDWYRAHFPTAAARRARADRAGAVAVGEASPYYLFHPAVPARVARTDPGMRIVVVLRDPVLRAWSHHRHEVRRGFESLDFAAAVAAEDARLAGEEAFLASDREAVSFEHQHHSYVARGRYAAQVERYLARFGRDQVLVLGAERLFADPGRTIARVHEFLGVAPQPTSTLPLLNATDGTPPPPDVAARLREHFAPHNAALYALLGDDLGWPGP